MTPISICFRPEFSMDRHAFTAIIGEQGIDPQRIEVISPTAVTAARPRTDTERYGNEFVKVTITDPDELVDLIEAINMIPDSHRMLQTMDTEEHFDGGFVEGEAARAERILTILEQAEGPGRAVDIYSQILTGEVDLDGLLDGMDNDDPDPDKP